MSRARALALAAALGAVGAACRPAEEGEPAQRAAYGDRFTLRLGESAVVDGGYRIRFTRVGEDSRCPEAVECAPGGSAAAAFAIDSRRGSATLTLHTDREPRKAAAMGGEVSLVELLPRPLGGAPPDTADYRATLIVEEAP